MVCAHGYSGNARDFDFLARELSAGRRVLCIDFPGRGESGWLPTPFSYNFPQFLADVRSLLAHAGVAQVQWVGTSMGALLGLLAAAQPRSPVASLVMNDVGAFVPTDALLRIGRNLNAPPRFASRAEGEAHLRATHADWGEISDRQWKHLARHGLRRSAGGWRLHYDPQIAQAMQALPLAPGLSFWSAWCRVACPVLLIRGERSEVFPAAVASTMLALKPRAELFVVENAGHAPALMSEREIDAVNGFLERTGHPGREGSPARSRRGRIDRGAWSAPA